MDENLNSSGGKVDNQHEVIHPDVEGTSVMEEQKSQTTKEDMPPAGEKASAPAGDLAEGTGTSAKKAGPPNLVKCDICLCEMSSGLVLSSHINGSRHKKRMKALQIVANLKAAGEKGVDLEPDSGKNFYRCEICSLTVNSPQQLELHIAGAKHKSKMAKERLLDIVISVTPPNKPERVDNPGSPPLKKRKKDNKCLLCDVCNIILNSKIQYEQHVLSKKHLGKAKEENNRKKKASVLENKSNIIQKFTKGNRFHIIREKDRDNSLMEGAVQQIQPINVNRIYQSQQNSRTAAEFSQINSGGMSNGPPFGNYFHPRSFANSHRNFGHHPETGKYLSKMTPHSFDSHPDSVLHSSSSRA